MKERAKSGHLRFGNAGLETLETRRLLAAQLVVTDSQGAADDLSVTLAETRVSRSSAEQTFTLTNTGDAALDVSNWAVGGDAGDFELSVEDNQGNTVIGDFGIPAGAAFTVHVVFTPTAVGARAGTIGFDTNDAGNPNVSLTLGGNAIPLGPQIQTTDDVAPNDDGQIDFTTIFLNTTTTQVVTLTNAGDSDLTISDLRFRAVTRRHSTLPSTTILRRRCWATASPSARGFRIRWR